MLKNKCHFGMYGINSVFNFSRINAYERENLKEEFISKVLKQRIPEEYWNRATKEKFEEYVRNRRRHLKQRLTSKGWVFDKIFKKRDFTEDQDLYIDYNVHTDNKKKVVGISSTIDSPEFRDCMYIARLQINKPVRGKGYGKKVIKEIVKDAIKKGNQCVHVDSLDTKSDKFYKKIGLTEYKYAQFYGDKKWMNNVLKNKQV